MRLLPEANNGRLLAVVLALIVAMLVYLLGVHWWFVAPHLDVMSQMSDLREQQQRFHETSLQRPQIEKRLVDVRTFEQNNQAFLAQSDSSAASADLIQRLKQAVSQHATDPNRCQVLTNQTLSGGKPELYERVTIQVRMRCDLEPFSSIVYELESGKPYLFVEQLMIYKQNYGYVPPNQRQPQQSALDVRFNLTGYLRKRGADKA
ncbi:type II secretion system protein GspM [Tahibacter soli]|jgi:general secretion pathway protein M|uniref:Type II secretion system protein GspM n=1 Tax=Tahibacter soli TaxID=2983605 RepID=A0A9X4BHZ8_9GAMM|nr:type II secretion system protein GspM [Tahibacter soli]MDC8014700.1 type II secretion system protein GspM [Tahibacter soli]